MMLSLTVFPLSLYLVYFTIRIENVPTSLNRLRQLEDALAAADVEVVALSLLAQEREEDRRESLDPAPLFGFSARERLLPGLIVF